MDIFNLFSKDACSLEWTWDEYFEKKGERSPGSVPISNEALLFLVFDALPYGKTASVLICHYIQTVLISFWSSGYLQKKLTPQFPQYHFVNMKGGIGALKKQA